MFQRELAGWRRRGRLCDDRQLDCCAPGRAWKRWGLVALAWCLLEPGIASAQSVWSLTRPEQRHIKVRTPAQLPLSRIPEVPPPPTVSKPRPDDPAWNLSLDEAIRIALANSDVVRLLAGNTAVSSGVTIYDPAVQNTQIDQARATFDPQLSSLNNWQQDRFRQGVFDPGPPPVAGIDELRTDGFQSTNSLSRQFATGTRAQLDVGANQNRNRGGNFGLNPTNSYNVDLGLTQPLLRGASLRANVAPIVIAQIETERSFFQLKGTVQDLVRSVVDSYWSLVFARINTWGRRQQVEQAREALDRAEARLLLGLADSAEVAQASSSYETFRANLLAAQGDLISQEAVLRNLLGLPPADDRHIVPVSIPAADRLEADWESISNLAATYRPDVVELKLILEADNQRLLIAENESLPQLDLGGIYRWNGLEGTTPDDQTISSSGPGGWQLGVNFSVPLGMRSGRAQLRQRELLLARDRANLDQGLHAALHAVARSYRNVSQYYEQYVAYRRAREAAGLNLEQQLAEYRAGQDTLFINVLQAITDWGNSVSLENQYLALYNTELATLELETGTILETHGVRFIEERFRSIGPLWQRRNGALYPRDIRPTPNEDQYAGGGPVRLPPAPGIIDGHSTGQSISELYGSAVVTPLPPVEEELPPPDAQIE